MPKQMLKCLMQEEVDSSEFQKQKVEYPRLGDDRPQLLYSIEYREVSVCKDDFLDQDWKLSFLPDPSMGQFSSENYRMVNEKAYLLIDRKAINSSIDNLLNNEMFGVAEIEQAKKPARIALFLEKENFSEQHEVVPDDLKHFSLIHNPWRTRDLIFVLSNNNHQIVTFRVNLKNLLSQMKEEVTAVEQ